MSDTPDAHSPPFDANVNNIDLHSVKDGRILGVSVYSGRAEVTRTFSFTIKPGQNQVSVRGLPTCLDEQSLRVEGKGEATIHDVTISRMEDAAAPESSPKLLELQAELSKTSKALQRAEKALQSVNKYLESLDTQHTSVEKLQSIVDSHDLTAGKLDEKIAELETTKAQLEKAVEEEKKTMTGPKDDGKLKMKASVGVFAKSEGEVELVLIYAVQNSNWSATYDIRVDMHTKEKPVSVMYKGAITQDTGEDWTDVPIKLETASPTFGVEIPSLDRWTVNVYRPVKYYSKGLGGGGRPGSNIVMTEKSKKRKSERRRSMDEASSNFEDAVAEVTSQGNITATFTIPGLMSIPSDGVAHNVTIAQLSLDAEMEWVSIPKREAKVHLKAIVKNVSEYTLLSGPASVYVDGSFIARTSLPAVSPDETFDCPLGIDPSIRVTYIPVVKKTTQSGFMTKMRMQTFTQRVTVHNTKSSSVDKVKIIDQIPVSEDSTITVKLLSPALPFAEGGSSASSGILQPTVENKLGVKVPAPITVAKGITAQWEGVDEISSEGEVEDLGGEGKFGWLCSIPGQGKVTLALQWEVSAPFKTAITGL